MTENSIYEFVRKRNRLERYERNLTESALKAITKIDKFRISRDVRHHERRLKGKKAKEQKEAKMELDQSIHLVKASAELQAESLHTLPKIKVEVSQQQSEENRLTEE